MSGTSNNLKKMKIDLTGKRILVLVFVVILLMSAGCKDKTEEIVAEATTSTSIIVTPSPSPTPKLTPTPVPTPTPIPEPSRQLQALYSGMPVYLEASEDADIISNLDYLQEIGYLTGPDNNGYVEVLLEGGRLGYCNFDQVSDAGQAVYAKDIEAQIKSALPTPEGEEPDETLHNIKLVDVRKYAPEILISQAFAREKNFLGEALYERPICLLQEATLIKLKKAQQDFAADGYTIKIYDAYRPYDVTVRFGDFLDNPIYLASPLTGSHHNRGVAIDMTLVDSEGRELEMPSLMHTLDFRASRLNEEMTPEARRNMDYMSAVMEANGFLLYKHEWWHFADSNRYNYPVMNYNLGKIEVYADQANDSVKLPPLLDPEDSGFVSIEPTPIPTPTPTPEPTTAPEPSQVPISDTTPEPAEDTSENTAASEAAEETA